MEACGLSRIPHLRDVFAIYEDAAGSKGYRGVMRDREATDLRLSSIAKGEEPIGWMQFNQDGFKRYCREYREYQDWKTNRNEARYATNIEHGRNYDSKNLMHTFRLLDMAEEIAREKRVTVRRPNRAPQPPVHPEHAVPPSTACCAGSETVPTHRKITPAATFDEPGEKGFRANTAEPGRLERWLSLSLGNSTC